MSAPDQVTDLYRELAIHRVQEAIDKLGRAPSDRLAAQTAEVLEEAAGALACITAVYVTPGGRLDERFHAADQRPDRRGREPRAARRLQPPRRYRRPTTTSEGRK